MATERETQDWNGEVGRYWAEHAERYDAPAVDACARRAQQHPQRARAQP